ncbi:MAG: hypothetical protein ACM37W_25355 [Actinomycetota bacterium]
MSATVAEMRSFLQTDRVKIYRFGEAGMGERRVELVYQERLPSLLELSGCGDSPLVPEQYLSRCDRV